MISVEFFSIFHKGVSNAELAGFRVSGHTGVAGESVVCAAVSSACYMAANTVTEVLSLKADLSVNDGLMQMMLDAREASRAQVILQGLRLHLEQLAEQYPNDITVTFSEVQ